jgi:hypothetical protein
MNPGFGPLLEETQGLLHVALVAATFCKLGVGISNLLDGL